MSTERFVEPAVVEALESVQEELRAERRTLEALPREHAELQARLAKLQGERVQLLGELEALKKGRPGKAPRLPERLEPPFELRPVSSLQRVARDALPALILVVLMSGLAWGQSPFMMGFFWIIMLPWMLKPALDRRSKRPRWLFGGSGLEEHVEGVMPVVVPYAEVLDVEVHTSFRQHRRGVGSVVIRCKPKSGGWQGQSLTLKDVPEPERLAEWIRSKRTGVLTCTEVAPR
jgi:hypothetical protein